MTNMDFAQLTSAFTEQYAAKLTLLTPQLARLKEKIPFAADEKVANLYHQPVTLTRSHGVVFNSDGSAFAIGSDVPIAAKYEDAQIRGSEMCVVENIAYSVFTRSKGGVKQYIKVLDHFIERNLEAALYHIELSILYGQTSMAATSEVTASGTSGTFTVTAATWAPGMWFGTEGMPLDVFLTVGAASPTNSNAAIYVTAVDESTRIVSFSCSSSDAAALDALTTSFIFRRGANNGSNSFDEFAGLDKIISNTGTLFNISAATYSLWKGTSHSCSSGPLTMGKIQQGLAKVANKGLMEKVLLVLSPASWANVMTDLAALRVIDSSYSDAKVKNGSTTITFYGQTGEIEFMPHPMCKEGEAFAFPLRHFKRIGSTDVTYELPGLSGQILFQLPGNAGVQFRSYTDQALFTDRVASCVKFTNIVNVTS